MNIRADQLINYIKAVSEASKEPVFNDKEMKDFVENLLAIHIPNKNGLHKKNMRIFLAK